MISVFENNDNSLANVYIRYLEKANDYLKNKEFDKARRIVEGIIRQEGNNSLLQELLHLINLEQLKEYKLSITTLYSGRRFNLDGVKGNHIIGNYDFFRFYKIKGWAHIAKHENVSLVIDIDNKIEEIGFNKKRLDVVSAFVKNGKDISENCGFDFTIDITSGAKIGLKTEQEVTWYYELTIAALPKIVRGKNNWLFLANDTNNSVEKITGNLLLNAKQKNNWINYSRKLKKFKKDYNFLYVIASAKEKVKSDKYPHVIKGKTITEQVEAILQNDGVNYLNPIESLTSNDRTFCKTASHWTDLGAYITYKQIMATSNNLNFIQAPKFTEVEVVGDLGSKLAPMETSVCVTFQDNPNIQIETPFDNKIKTTGGLRIHINNKVGNKKSVVIFGSSTMHEGQLTKYLSYSFSRVVEVNLSGSIIAEIVRYEQPDLVIVLNDERLLSASGDIFKTFNETAAFKKLSQLSKDKKKEILLHLENISEETFYINLVKAALSE